MGKRNTASIEPENALTHLQQLELDHAKQHEGILDDFMYSDALTTDQSQIGKGYVVRILLAIFSIGLGVTGSYWGFTPPAAILNTIDADIGPSDNKSLFPILWSTSAAISIIVFGRMSDKFGRRYWVLGASILGFVGGIVACTAKTMDTLIGANILLGLAGGVHSSFAVICGEMVPNKYKVAGVVICLLPAVIPTGFGAFLANMLTHTANWRWCYYIYLMMIFGAFVMQYFFYHPPTFKQLHGGKRTIMDEVKRVDFVGTGLLVIGLAVFLLGVSWGGQPSPWSSPKILSLIIIGGVVLILFVFWELYANIPNPLVPMHFFRDLRGFVCLNIICAVSGIVYISLSIIWPSQVAAIYPETTGWREDAWLSTTVAFGIFGGIVIFGSVMHKVKHIRIQLVVFTVVCTAFTGALVTANTSNRSRSAVFSFLSTLPAGILEIIPVSLVQLDANDADLGTVFAIIFLMRTAAGSIFTSVFVAILTNKLPTEIAARVPQAAIEAGLPQTSLTKLFAAITIGTPAALEAVPGISPAILAAVSTSLTTSYAAAYAYVYYAAVAVGCVGVIAALCLKDYDSLLTSHVSRQMYRKGHGVNANLDKKTADVELHSDSERNNSPKIAAEYCEEIRAT